MSEEILEMRLPVSSDVGEHNRGDVLTPSRVARHNGHPIGCDERKTSSLDFSRLDIEFISLDSNKLHLLCTSKGIERNGSG